MQKTPHLNNQISVIGSVESSGCVKKHSTKKSCKEFITEITEGRGHE